MTYNSIRNFRLVYDRLVKCPNYDFTMWQKCRKLFSLTKEVEPGDSSREHAQGLQVI